MNPVDGRPLWARFDEYMDVEYIMRDVEKGDEILLSGRSRPLTVIGECYNSLPSPSIHHHLFVQLEGNGCRYRLAKLENHRSNAWLDIKSSGEWKKYEDVYFVAVKIAKKIREDVRV